jgi:hexosaminidase
MKKILMLSFCFSLLFNAFSQTTHAIIPKPQEIKFEKSSFEINKTTVISYDTELAYASVDLLQKKILTIALEKLALKTSKPKANSIHFSLAKTVAKEAYEITINGTGIEVRASSTEGFYYSYQTLLQLLPPAVFGSSYQAGLKFKFPGVQIKDQPRFGYRGVLMDVGRYYFPPFFIKKLIDQLAVHKMNTLHWHLTEDQGWRIEIKKYPKLTEIGSKRKESPQGYYSDNKGDNTPHGGFYTQDEVREIVAYAQARHVTIIPEIEMPGHALAALAAYPELGCSGGPYEVKSKWGVEEQVFCPTEKTFAFLEDVLTEVLDLFPGTYIHLGGDECPKTTWKASAFCQDLIKKENLVDEHGLQSYFTKRIDSFLTSKGRKLIGWDEILEGGLSPNATVMSWRGTSGGIAAAKQKHDVIMAPYSHMYLDYYQTNPKNEPLAIGGLTTLETTYSFEPYAKELNAEDKKYIKGVEALLWTEFVATPEKAEYMLYPRLSAAAEIAWSPAAKDYTNFKMRLNSQLERYKFLGINYSKAIYDIDFSLEKNKMGDYTIKMASPNPGTQIRYTVDGSEPTDKSTLYSENKSPLLTSNPNLAAALYSNSGKMLGKACGQPYTFSKSLGKKYTLENPADQYIGFGTNPLTDGLKSFKYKNEEWVGFKDKNMNVTIELEQLSQVNRLDMSFLSDQNNGIYLPAEVSIFASKDGKEYTLAKKIDLGQSNQKSLFVQQINAGFETQTAKFVRVIAKNSGHANSDKKNRFIMIDEVAIH